MCCQTPHSDFLEAKSCLLQMMIGWATPDFHGDGGKGINFLTRMTGFREVNYDPTLMNLVSSCPHVLVSSCP